MHPRVARRKQLVLTDRSRHVNAAYDLTFTKLLDLQQIVESLSTTEAFSSLRVLAPAFTELSAILEQARTGDAAARRCLPSMAATIVGIQKAIEYVVSQQNVEPENESPALIPVYSSVNSSATSSCWPASDHVAKS
jgi:hypothetical protein